MKTNLISALIISVAIGFGTGCDKENNNSTLPPGGSGSLSRSCQLHADMRALWEDHIVYTRNVICNLVDGLPGKDQAIARLMKNQEDIGGAVAVYYGVEAGTALTNLLKSHIAISADVVNAAKAGDRNALDAANARWFANADSIAGFLSSANPHWPLEDMKRMMHEHLRLTTNEAVARINHDYPGDIEAYDAVHKEILEMSDMLADGIVKQFPDQF